MKIYLNKIKEDWIIDRLRKEWYTNNKKISTSFVSNSNIVWLIAPWMWKNVSTKFLKSKTVVCSIYHIEEMKLTKEYLKEFYERDKYVDYYHVISKKTYLQLNKLTNKNIFNYPFWINNNKFFEIQKKDTLKNKYQLNNFFLIGSFQRDSEGEDTTKPKLIKGPDRLVKIFREFNNEYSNLKIVLTGKRRDYIKAELDKYKIEYVHLEMVNYKQLNELYNCLDLYIVASRIEGGPQAILECAITKTPIISTDVGVASEILSSESIFDMDNFKNALPNTEFAYHNALKYVLPDGMNAFVNYFKNL